MPGITSLRLTPGSWSRLLQAALVLVLLVQVVRLGLGLRTPAHPTPAPASTGPIAADALAGHDPFFGGQALAAAPAPADGWRLHGLRTGIDGGAAILSRADSRQGAYAPGDVLEGALVLHAVGADHVVLREGELLRELALADAGTHAAPPAPQAVSPPPAAAAGMATTPPTGSATTGGTHADVNPAQLLASAGLRRLAEAGATAGYALLPRGDDRLVRAAGLQPGDVLLSVNGQPLDPEHLADLAARLKDDPRAVITYRRDGQVRTLTLGNAP